MKFSEIKATSFLFLVLFTLNACALEAKKIATYEPFIGLSFDSDSVVFEPLQPTPEVQKAFDGQQQWIFAKCSRGNDSVFVVSGWIKNWSDSRNGDSVYTIEPDFGSVIRMSEKGVGILGVPDGLFVSGKNSILSPEDTKCLMEDAVKRYLSAFGGHKRLQKILNQKGVSSDGFPAALVDAMKAEGLLISDKRGNP